jgi:hypothetical protein
MFPQLLTGGTSNVHDVRTMLVKEVLRRQGTRYRYVSIESIIPETSRQASMPGSGLTYASKVQEQMKCQ